jgi:hypothetical protein
LASVVFLSLADRDDGLTQQQQLSLLNRSESDRFWMLPMVQSYAAAELIGAEFSEMLTERWLEWLLEFTQLYGIDLELHAERVQTVGFEYRHLLRAIRWCREHGRWEILLQLAEGIWSYLYQASLFGECREILEGAVQGAKVLEDRRCEERIMYRLGLLFWVQRQDEKGLLDHLERIEEIAHRYKDEAALGRVDNIRSDVLLYQGHLVEVE